MLFVNHGSHDSNCPYTSANLMGHAELAELIERHCAVRKWFGLVLCLAYLMCLQGFCLPCRKRTEIWSQLLIYVASKTMKDYRQQAHADVASVQWGPSGKGETWHAQASFTLQQLVA